MTTWIDAPDQESVVKWLMKGIEKEQTTVKNALVLAYSLGILYKPKERTPLT